MFDRFFKLGERGTSLGTEVLAGETARADDRLAKQAKRNPRRTATTSGTHHSATNQ
jgi:hypothetical protein